MGGLFVLVGLGNLGWAPLASPWTFGPCVLVLGLLAWRTQAYYNDTYGRVRASRRKQIAYGAATIAAGAALIGGSFIDFRVQLPISVFAASFAAAMLFTYHVYTGLKRHHVIVWGALLAVALIPVWGSFTDRASVAWLPVGVATAVAGLLDHRLLVRLSRDRELAAARV